ncbi:MAG TPA: replication-associated recombination protein A [Clostridiales bacterium]|jgi:putative ATPase|nr:replication-associated recombination protein A [Clostridiales bacterium]
MKNTRLADILRPTGFDELVGQQRLFGERGILRRMVEDGRVTNMIFHGPPGTGKTTAASIIAQKTQMTFYRLNATVASLSDLKEIMSQTSNIFGAGGILLYLDEIQYFNRKQQQALLDYIEDGRVTLIASTTDNPHFYIHPAIISRSTLFEFLPVEPEECARALRRALKYLNESAGKARTADEDTLLYIGKRAGGDVRRAINLLENAYYAAEDKISRAEVDLFDSNVGNYSEDAHYDLLSALQKSVRGSNPDAAVFYLVKLLEAGELNSVCRRLLVIASEDIGLAYPQAAAVTYSCVAAARELGMPEARIPLANATLLLATAPKSNSAYAAAMAALGDIQKGLGNKIPEHLSSPLFKGYRYPHDYPGHYVAQQYLPDDIAGRKYYVFGDNKTERVAAAFWERIKNPPAQGTVTHADSGRPGSKDYKEN